MFDGNLARYSEANGRVLTYRYDDIGRLLQVSGDDGSYIKTSYDNVDKSTQLHYKVNGQRRDVYFGYSTRDNLPLDVRFGTDSKYIVENNYDELTRLKFKTYTIPSTGSKINTSYRYIDWSGDNSNRTTSTVKGIDYTYTSGGLTTYDRWYTYDKVGNILSECSWESSTSKPVRESYTYDSKNQLVRHNSVTQNCTIEYSYDSAGNITAKNTYAYTQGDLTGVTPTKTVTYGYNDSSWHDLLTSYDGQAIEYDAIGNPTAYRGWTMSWQGRQLESAARNGTSLSFTYDSDGIRTSKTVGTVTTSYLLNGTQILAQTTNGKTICFFYDQQGSRVAMADSSNHIYYYLYNLQGDVIALADSATGKLAATYTYDAWGKCTVTNATGFTIGTDNPFRYRGYYYDSETELYYLQSRYYDAETGRFINADGQLNLDDGVIGCNLFAYCGNNPVMRADSDGHFWSALAIGFATGIVGQYISDVIGNISSGKTGSDIFKPTSSARDYLASGVGCAIAAIPGLNIVGTMVAGAAGNVASDYLKGNISSLEDAGKSAVRGGVANAMGYGVSKGFAALKVKQIENMSRSSRKAYLRDKIYCNSQANVNKNLKTFTNSSMPTNINLVETQLALFRSGTYSSVTSMIVSLG